MNREYVYNRDKGKCKVCGSWLNSTNRHCHRIDSKLSINQINKVSNLAWICKDCDKQVHGTKTLIGTNTKVIKKIEKYRSKST